MSKDYIVHWLLGITCAAIWFWGKNCGIPTEAVNLAASVVPSVLAHAMAFTPATTAPVAPIETAPVAPVQPS